MGDESAPISRLQGNRAEITQHFLLQRGYAKLHLRPHRHRHQSGEGGNRRLSLFARERSSWYDDQLEILSLNSEFLAHQLREFEIEKQAF